MSCCVLICSALSWFVSALLLLGLEDITRSAAICLGELKTNHGPATEVILPGKTPTVSRKSRHSAVPLALGVFALVISPLWPAVLILNSYVVALGLLMLLPQGDPLFTLILASWVRDIFVNDIIGFIVCLLEAVGAAAWLRCLIALADGEPQRGMVQGVRKLKIFAICLFVAALVFELAISANRGWNLGGLANATGSALGALVAGLGEVVLGALILAFLVIPILTAPVAWISSWRRPRRPRVVGIYSRFPRLLLFLAFLDRMLLEPLRTIDRLTFGSRYFQRQQQEPDPVTGQRTLSPEITTSETTIPCAPVELAI